MIDTHNDHIHCLVILSTSMPYQNQGLPHTVHVVQILTSLNFPTKHKQMLQNLFVYFDEYYQSFLLNYITQNVSQEDKNMSRL